MLVLKAWDEWWKREESICVLVWGSSDHGLDALFYAEENSELFVAEWKTRVWEEEERSRRRVSHWLEAVIEGRPVIVLSFLTLALCWLAEWMSVVAAADPAVLLSLFSHSSPAVDERWESNNFHKLWHKYCMECVRTMFWRAWDTHVKAEKAGEEWQNDEDRRESALLIQDQRKCEKSLLHKRNAHVPPGHASVWCSFSASFWKLTLYRSILVSVSVSKKEKTVTDGLEG